MPPGLIRQCVSLLEATPGAPMATLCRRIDAPAEVFDPNVVKVVFNLAGEALYFSRAPIPWDRRSFAAGALLGEHYRHLGIYAYRAGFLSRYVTLEPAPLERCEALEQLRALHHGMPIRIEEPAAARRGIDISGQRARRVRNADFDEFDHILAMDAGNRANYRVHRHTNGKEVSCTITSHRLP